MKDKYAGKVAASRALSPRDGRRCCQDCPLGRLQHPKVVLLTMGSSSLMNVLLLIESWMDIDFDLSELLWFSFGSSLSFILGFVSSLEYKQE